MQRRHLEPFELGSQILQALRNGILLTSAAGDRVNTMTIAWGFLGVDWQKPVFITLVRTGRFSRSLLDQNPEFTINAPVGQINKKILALAGTRSGRELDKIATLGLHLVPAEKISVPAILEFPLTLECRVIYRQEQDPRFMPPAIRNGYHPQDIDSSVPGINRDFHIAYYGEIVSAYILEA